MDLATLLFLQQGFYGSGIFSFEMAKPDFQLIMCFLLRIFKPQCYLALFIAMFSVSIVNIC